jgi:signal peptidase I
MTDKEKKPEQKEVQAAVPFKKKVIREIVSWAWVIAAFLFIQSTLVQARVIPSGSMEQTLQIGDHLLVSRIGYDAEIPFTGVHWSLWRDPQRQQVIVFRPTQDAGHDLIKRIIGVPGDRLEIKEGVVWINGRPLEEPYLAEPPNPMDNHSEVTVPPGNYFVMGDNRANSYDSRYWGFLPRENVIGTPLIIYMSVDTDPIAWQPGKLGARFAAYGRSLLHPNQIRWSRLFTTF